MIVPAVPCFLTLARSQMPSLLPRLKIYTLCFSKIRSGLSATSALLL